MFPRDEHCAAYLEKVRWRDGFVCSNCGHGGEPYRFARRRGVLRCRKSERDTSLTAGTIMERSRTPLRTWFWGAYLVSSLTPGISAVQFQRHLGLSRYETAFQMLHKLRAGMVRPDRDRIGANWPVEFDETYLGGRVRGAGGIGENKTLVAGAVEVRRQADPDGQNRHDLGKPSRRKFHAGRLRLHIVRNRGHKAIEAFVVANIERGARIATDGHRCYRNLRAMGYEHEAIPTFGKPDVIDKVLPMIHLVFSNLKTWIQGTHHGVSPKHTQSYLNEFVFRFNRRFWPFNAFNSLLGIATQVAAPTYEGLYSTK